MAQNAILAWLNQVDRPEAALSTDSQVGTLPVANLADPVVAKVWRTSATTGAQVTVDFGAPVPVRALALAGCTLAGTDTVRHRLSAVAAGDGELLDTGTIDSDVADPGPSGQAQGLSGAGGYGLHFYLHDQEVSARWWRCDVSAPSRSAEGYFDIGRAFAAPAWQPERNLAFGLEDEWADDSRLSRAVKSGAEYVDAGPRYRVVSFALPAMSAGDRDRARELARVAGASRQVLFVPDPEGDWPQEAVLGRIERTRPIVRARLAVWATAYTIRQSL